jgi:hypothetical protein
VLLLKSVGRYVLALWAQWKVLLTGSSIIALAAIWALLTGRALPNTVGWLIVGITFIAASFLAWRREYEQARAVQTTRSPREERQARIARWRRMVMETHIAMQRQRNKTVTELLERHPDFPSIRSHLSERSKEGLSGRRLILRPDQSTMDGALHSILDDIDRMEDAWHLK